MRIFGQPLRLVVFDLDGVLIDLHRVLQTNLENTAIAMGLDSSPIAHFMARIEQGTSDTGDRGLISSVGAYLHITGDDLKKFRALFPEKEKENPIPAFPFTNTILQWLTHKNIYSALCTNNTFDGMMWKLKTAGIPWGHFITEATSSLGFQKPDPRMLQYVLDASCVPPRKTIFVGDWYADIKTAQVANVAFVGVLSGSLQKHVFLREGISEDHIIDSINDLPGLITE